MVLPRVCFHCSDAHRGTAGGRHERPDDFPAIDFGMWLRMAGAGWEFAFVDETLGAYRIHSSNALGRIGPPQGPGYVQGIEIIALLKTVKLRFLDTHDGRIAEPRKLRRLAEQARRHAFVVMARNLTLPERKPGPTFRALAAAVRADPGVPLAVPAWRLAGASLLGPRLVERIRKLSADVTILARGVGSGIQEETEIKPKPMVEIGGAQARPDLSRGEPGLPREIGGALSELGVDGRLWAV